MRVRNRQMKAQNGRCYYCDQPIWLQDINRFCAHYDLSKEHALAFKCTAEHLIARTDGGPDTDDNIVAACHYCHQVRHEEVEALTPDKYINLARTEIKAGRWHGLQLAARTYP